MQTTQPETVVFGGGRRCGMVSGRLECGSRLTGDGVRLRVRYFGGDDVKELCPGEGAALIFELLSALESSKNPSGGQPDAGTELASRAKKLLEGSLPKGLPIGELAQMLEVSRELGLPNRVPVYLSPVFGRLDPARIVDFMQDNNIIWATAQLQLHKIIWPGVEKGV